VIIALALATMYAQTQTMWIGQTAKPDGKLTKVEDRKNVCMGTDKVSTHDLIPIKIQGRTYYACCNMCKTMLANDPYQRAAIDPVSNQQVDKSLAVIGVSSDGTAVYFESEKDLETYNATH
jgi:YHS domain-containing protein